MGLLPIVGVYAPVQALVAAGHVPSVAQQSGIVLPQAVGTNQGRSGSNQAVRPAGPQLADLHRAGMDQALRDVQGQQ